MLHKKFSLTILIVVLFFAGCTPVNNNRVDISAENNLPHELGFDGVIKKVSPAVVKIESENNPPLYKEWAGDYDDFYYGNPSDGGTINKPVKTGSGSGFIISKDGLILTSNHIVGSNTDLKVVMNNGKEYEARIIIREPFNDIAVLKIKNEMNDDLPVTVLGDSSKLQSGQQVIAIGSDSNSAGVVTGMGQNLKIENINLNDLIQTDTDISSGYSGGPLINLYGEVVGVNTAFANNKKGISFSIPINTIKKAILDDVR